MEKLFISIRKDTPGTTDAVELTQEVAEKMLDRWVRLLHLEDWNISFRWRVRASDMFLEDSLGCTRCNTVSRQAIIQMIDPVDFENETFRYDYEKTMVHELLHLTFADLDDTGDQLRDKLTHVMIDRLARALVDAERSVLEC